MALGESGSGWTGAASRRLRCCACDGPTDDSEDYVLVELTAQFPDAQ
ncbi:hypothetical protein ACFVZH_28460 [Streptomyces sp. NPDC059534]